MKIRDYRKTKIPGYDEPTRMLCTEGELPVKLHLELDRSTIKLGYYISGAAFVLGLAWITKEYFCRRANRET
jgi:hypothetical protein